MAKSGRDNFLGRALSAKARTVLGMEEQHCWFGDSIKAVD